MTREDILKEVLSIKGSNLLLELATGVGKSRLALEKIKSLKDKKNLLIVVNRIVHKQNWKDEIEKWWPNCSIQIQFTTYASLPKYAGVWDCAIFDECHHLSERCREALCNFTITHSVLCSATINKDLKSKFEKVFTDLVTYKKDLRDVIDEGILPDPIVYLWPLELETGSPTECIWRNSKSKGKILECDWASRWNFIKQRTYPVKIYCNEWQYHNDLCNQIDYWKRVYLRTRSQIAKNKWLKLCADRLKWLSDKKIKYLHQLLTIFLKHRTITFCNSIEQTELLGEYCINSKNFKSVQNLEDFNKGKIHHITACNMLNEGMNLVDCQIGIYANLNSSKTITKQRIGRLLRHPNPIMVIPYFKNSREEEIVEEMLENYNKDLVRIINNVKEIIV